MKRILSFVNLFLLGSIIMILAGACSEETDTNPPPELYEFMTSVGDGFVNLKWAFTGFGLYGEYGLEVTYYLNGEKKVKKSTIGASGKMTISGLTNNIQYTFKVVYFDDKGDKTEGFEFTRTPNTPFVFVSPVNEDDYIIENGKIRINVHFNRIADTTLTHQYELYGCWYLSANESQVEHSITWLEEGMILSILTNETKEVICPNLPCDLALGFQHQWVGGSYYISIKDINGMLLDADRDGKEGGGAEVKFTIE